MFSLGAVPYYLLGSSLLCFLFFSKRAIGFCFFFAALYTSFSTQKILPLGYLVVFLFLGLFYLYAYKTNKDWQKHGLFILLTLFSLALSAHLIPGFQNLKLIHQVKLSTDSLPYSLWLNWDKPLVAIGFLWFCYHPPKLLLKQWGKSLIFHFAFAVVVLMALSFLFGYIRWDPKLPSFTFIWVFKVLLLTCFAEECLFRGLIWQGLQRMGATDKMTLLFSAVFFGLIHYAGGSKYIVLSSVAGIFYGQVLLKTNWIGSSILLHFLVNLTHFLLFSYPALASS